MKWVALFALFLGFSGFSGFSANAEEFPTPIDGPVNPAWEAYMRSARGRSEDPRLGYIPSPLPVRIHRPGQEALSPAYRPPRGRADITSPKYDLRDPNGDGDTADGLLTRVQNQGQCGVCWTFSTYASLESHLKKTLALADAENDYSENHLKHLNGFSGGPCSTGNFDKVVAYLARHDGPATELCDPYAEDSSSANPCPAVRYVDNAVMMPARSGSTDNDYIKQALLTYGALQTAMWWDDASYNASNYTYYWSEPPSGPYTTNHGVTIVGWDDAKLTDGGTGAFIMKNSWGADWGENGYFYISYNDARVCCNGLGYFIDADDSSFEFNQIYQYDPFGYNATVGYSGQTEAWGANRFSPTNDGVIRAVGLYLPHDGMNFDITVYDTRSVNGSIYSFSSPLGIQNDGSAVYAGYYTARLDTPIPIHANDDFIVSVRFDATSAGSNFPVPQETPTPSAYNATANAGESYISWDGIHFADRNATPNNISICLKAFVIHGDLIPEITVTGGTSPLEIPDGDVTPQTDDDTDFGTSTAGGTVVNHVFTIHNDGIVALNLTGNPRVSLSGSSDFAVMAQPSSASVVAGGNLSFTLRFTPTTVGTQTATVSIANDDADENPYTFTVRGMVNPAPAPEIRLTGGLSSLEIPDGDATPQTSDDTDFGTSIAGGGAVDHSFTIHNDGPASLNLTGNPIVNVSGSPDFAVMTQPSSATVAPGGSLPFTVRFTPTTVGTQTATISIASDDADENPYTITVRGVITSAPTPEIRVTGGSSSLEIPDGDITPQTSDDTDFGPIIRNGMAVQHVFTIRNDGTAALSLTATPRVSLSGSSDFAVMTQPSSATVAAGGNVSFTVRFTPTTVGTQTASVSIASDDADETPYTFTLRGLVRDFADVNGDGATDLTDAMLALRIAAGVSISSEIHTDADVDGNNAIGVAEAVAALRRAAGL